MTVEHSAIRALVEPYLADPLNYEWSLQGLGMLRTYVGDRHRLHIWDDRYVVEDVSPLHTHPWDMRSYVVSGEIRQYRYILHPAGEKWNGIRIKCGPGGGPCGDHEPAHLKRNPAGGVLRGPVVHAARGRDSYVPAAAGHGHAGRARGASGWRP